jgi:tetrahydromethanopterin S-methyltransferase subunit B
MQSVHITTNVVSSYPTHDEVYSMQHYVTQVGGFFVGDFFGGGRATHFKKLVLNGK